MTPLFADIAPLLGWLDIAALGLLCVGAILIGWQIEHPPKSRPSVTLMMAKYRLEWMRLLTERNNRIFDTQILGHLQQSTSFLASTSLIAIGGVLALIGNVDPLTGLAEELHADAAPKLLWQIKLMVVALFLALAFIRFLWANRVFGYCAIMMGAIPINPDTTPELAHRAGELNIRAGLNFNRGLRAMYYALAAIAWLLGPVGLLLATLTAHWIVWSREFASVPWKTLSR